MKAEVKTNIIINLEFTKKEQESIDIILNLLDEIDHLVEDYSPNMNDTSILTDGSSQYSDDISYTEILHLYNKLNALKEMRIPRIEITSKEDE